MYQDTASLGKSVVNKTVTGREMLSKICCWGVQLADPFVRILLRELWVKAGSHSEDVSDAIAAQNVFVG